MDLVAIAKNLSYLYYIMKTEFTQEEINLAIKFSEWIIDNKKFGRNNAGWYKSVNGYARYLSSEAVFNEFIAERQNILKSLEI